MSIDAIFLGGTSLDIIQNNRQKGRGGLNFTASVGGSITNSCVIAAKLGLKTAILSRVGKDELGDYAIEYLKSISINTNGVTQDSDIRTPLAIAKIDKKGDAKYIFYKNLSKGSIVALNSIPKYLLNSCKVFHTGSSYSYQKESFKETLKFIKYLKNRGVFISYDPNIRPNSITDNIGTKNRVLKLLKLSNLAKLSETDLLYLTGQKNHIQGLKILKKITNCEIILTLGSKGSCYYNHVNLTGCQVWQPVRLTKVPAFKVKVVDTIGAGDAFSAGLIYNLIKQGKNTFFSKIDQNMRFASAVSAIICTKKGSHKALKDSNQINSFINN